MEIKEITINKVVIDFEIITDETVVVTTPITFEL